MPVQKIKTTLFLSDDTTTPKKKKKKNKDKNKEAESAGDTTMETSALETTIGKRETGYDLNYGYRHKM